MKIVFFGTPKLSAQILQDLINEKINIIAVVTQPDKPYGRGLKIIPSSVAQIAEEYSISLYKPHNISDPNFIKTIKDLASDIIIVVAYGKIFRKELLDLPKFGCINIHGSFLPKYRGASPIQSALLNGDKTTGVTIMKMNENLDSGGIIAQETISIDDADNSDTLSKKIFNTGSKLILEILSSFENGLVKIIPQNDVEATYTRTIKKEDGKINFSKSAEEIHNMIRAFNPWPGTFVCYKGKKVKILKSKTLTPASLRSASPLPKGEGDSRSSRGVGEIIGISKEKGLIFTTGSGLLSILELHPENSKAISAIEFVSGYRVKIGDKFE